MSWANQRVYTAFQSLPEEALDAFIVNPEWTARKLLQHIASGSDWYVFCLGIADWSDVPSPNSISDISGLAQRLELTDSQILSAVALEDELLSFEEGPETHQVLRSTLLAEAILHATEHRAQLMDAIESRGFHCISLDTIDLWSFESYERQSSGSAR
jgi:uncharacterized damage-inducible protein DinB